MREHPEKIEQISIEIADLNEQLQNLRERIDKQEALITLEIVTAKDEQASRFTRTNLCEMPRSFYRKINQAKYKP